MGRSVANARARRRRPTKVDGLRGLMFLSASPCTARSSIARTGSPNSAANASRNRGRARYCRKRVALGRFRPCRRPQCRPYARHDRPHNVGDSDRRGGGRNSSDRILVIPWMPPSPYRRRSAGRAGSGSAASRQGPSSRTFPDCWSAGHDPASLDAAQATASRQGMRTCGPGSVPASTRNPPFNA